jgi:hypothetical protein
MLSGPATAFAISDRADANLARAFDTIGVAS